MERSFSDSSEVAEWLGSLDDGGRRVYAARCALRTLPHMAFGSWRGENEKAALLAFRKALRLCVLERSAPQGNDSEISEALDGLIGIELSSKNARLDATRYAARAAANAASSAVGSTAAGADKAIEAMKAAVSSQESAALAETLERTLLSMLQAARLDALSESPAGHDEIQASSIWSGMDRPPEVAAVWNALSGDLLAKSAKWEFWRKWYQGMVDGEPLPLDLQREVALIPDEDWQNGPEHIARLIAEIEARFALKARIRELEEELSRASTDRLGIGGNNPPEPIADAPWIAKEFTIIWAPLQDLKAEVEREAPEPSRVARLLALLGDALRHGLRWCASKADLIVDSSIKWAVPALGTGYLVLNPDKLSAVIEAGKRLLSILP